MSCLPFLLRIHILLQGEGVLEVQQPEAESGARLPKVYSAWFHGLRWLTCRLRLGLEPSTGRRTATIWQWWRWYRTQAGEQWWSRESGGHRHPLRPGPVHDGSALHRVPLQEEGYAAPHTVLQAIHAGVGLRIIGSTPSAKTIFIVKSLQRSKIDSSWSADFMSVFVGRNKGRHKRTAFQLPVPIVTLRRWQCVIFVWFWNSVWLWRAFWFLESNAGVNCYSTNHNYELLNWLRIIYHRTADLDTP